MLHQKIPNIIHLFEHVISITQWFTVHNFNKRMLHKNISMMSHSQLWETMLHSHFFLWIWHAPEISAPQLSIPHYWLEHIIQMPSVTKVPPVTTGAISELQVPPVTTGATKWLQVPPNDYRCHQWLQVPPVTAGTTSDCRCHQWLQVPSVTTGAISDYRCHQWLQVPSVTTGAISDYRCHQWLQASSVTTGVISDYRCNQWLQELKYIFNYYF